MAPRRNPNNSPHTQIMPEGEIQAQLNDLQAAVRIHTIDPLSGSNYDYPNSSLPTETTASLAKRTQATLYNNFYNNYKELSASPESTVAVACSSPVLSILSMQQQQPQQFNNMSPMQTTNNKPTTNNNINHNSNTLSNHHNLHNSTANGTTASEYIYLQCCYPNGDCHKCDTTLICTQDLSDCVKVICNNENCSMGQYMHKQCFDGWEQSILSSLKNMGGRVRSWSERQKVQNIWTKKGYDLIYKLCNCKCGRGHLRKDLEWIAPKASVTFNGSNNGQQRIMNDSNSGGGGGGVFEEEDKKNKSNSGKKKRNRSNNNSNSTSNQAHKNTCQTQAHLQQEQQSHLGDCRTSTVAANITGGMEQMRNSYNNLLPAPNVGVIGSGLPQHHHNNTNTNQLKQSPCSKLQCSTEAPGSGVGSLLLSGGGQSSLVNSNNNNNILGLDLGSARSNSTSSGGNNSGSSSPSAILTSQNGGTNDQANCMPLQHVPQNFTMNGYYSQQPQHMGGAPPSKNSIQPASIMTASLTKTILNGLNNLNNSALLGGVNNSGNIIVGNNTTTNLIHGSASSSNTAPHTLIINPQQHAANSVLTLNGFKQLSPYEQQQFLLQQKLKEVEIYSEKVRSTSGCNGIFSRRLDFSSFNILPKTRLNSYQVKIEDEGNHGNDETRLFILSSLAQSQKNRVACIICEETMLVFDRYPLVDGSFFLSPKQHSADCIEVKYEGRVMFLTCVCLRCSDGSSTNRSISCRFCAEKWDGSNLVLGTMYAYDVFAAMPCCMERIKCNNCFKMLLHPQQRLNFYSDYSHCVTCPFCATQDTHFVKPLNYCYVKSIPSRLIGIA